MYQVVGYHRPTSVSEALHLLASAERLALAGGVHVHHDGGAVPTEAVDLQALGLDTIEIDGEAARLGATVRLQALVDDVLLPDTIREAARAEQPSTLRALATVGGTIANAAGDSLLLAALLAHDAVVRLQSEKSGPRDLSLGNLLLGSLGAGELILDVRIHTDGSSLIARTGRTPQDRPIVGVVGRRSGQADDAVTTLALCGIGAVPVLVGADGVESLQPIDDHRATASYRRHLADVLATRVLEGLS